MNREQIMNTFKQLAMSQGSYCRIVRELSEMSEEEYDEVMTSLESKNFKSPVDLILFIEG